MKITCLNVRFCLGLWSVCFDMLSHAIAARSKWLCRPNSPSTVALPLSESPECWGCSHSVPCLALFGGVFVCVLILKFQTQDLAYTRSRVYHWATSPALFYGEIGTCQIAQDDLGFLILLASWVAGIIKNFEWNDFILGHWACSAVYQSHCTLSFYLICVKLPFGL